MENTFGLIQSGKGIALRVMALEMSSIIERSGVTILYSDNTWIGATRLLSIFKGQTLNLI